MLKISMHLYFLTSKNIFLLYSNLSTIKLNLTPCFHANPFVLDFLAKFICNLSFKNTILFFVKYFSQTFIYFFQSLYKNNKHFLRFINMQSLSLLNIYTNIIGKYYALDFWKNPWKMNKFCTEKNNCTRQKKSPSFDFVFQNYFWRMRSYFFSDSNSLYIDTYQFPSILISKRAFKIMK